MLRTLQDNVQIAVDWIFEALQSCLIKLVADFAELLNPTLALLVLGR
jgi:hypothetical protein